MWGQKRITKAKEVRGELKDVFMLADRPQMWTHNSDAQRDVSEYLTCIKHIGYNCKMKLLIM